MKQTLYIMQGAPGSGKSTVAKALQYQMRLNGKSCVICSTDDFHYVINERGERVYLFQKDKLAEFHRLNKERAIEALKAGFSVIVDNTNIQRWTCRDYVRYAADNGIPVVFIRVNGSFPNIHGVPDEAVSRMRTQMEDLTVEAVLTSKTPWERESTPEPLKTPNGVVKCPAAS